MSDLQDRVEVAVSDQYTIERELGQGAMAVVFLARGQADDRRVAIKAMNPDLDLARARERFEREIHISSQLKHPHIVPILGVGGSGDLLYYVMEYMDGESLRQRLERERWLPIPDAIRFAREVGSALAYAHAVGVIHRDIKPENIMLVDGRAMVTDFGVARAMVEPLDEVLTLPGTTLGTPYYMSPEQARGTRRLDGRSDIYSLGCVLYEMLAGEPPFTGDSDSAIIARRIMAPPPHVRDVRSDVPKSVDHVLFRALATNPDNRLDSAALLVEALQPAN